MKGPKWKGIPCLLKGGPLAGWETEVSARTRFGKPTDEPPNVIPIFRKGRYVISGRDGKMVVYTWLPALKRPAKWEERGVSRAPTGPEVSNV